MILFMIYLKHHSSAPIQKAVCPICGEVESKNVETGVVDACVLHLTFKQEFACHCKPEINVCLFINCNHDFYLIFS